MPKKPNPPKQLTQLEWLLAERDRKTACLANCVDKLLGTSGKTSRNPTPCDIATAVFVAASEYETAAAAVLIAAHQVYQYASSVRQAAQEEMSRVCTPNV